MVEEKGIIFLNRGKLTPFRAQKKDQPEGWSLKVKEGGFSRVRLGGDPNGR